MLFTFFRNRLNRIKALDEESKYRDAITAQRKLKSLEEARGRAVPMHRVQRDNDSDSRSSSATRPRSVGAKNTSLYSVRNIKDAAHSKSGRNRVLPSVSAAQSTSNSELLRSSSGASGKRGKGRNIQQSAKAKANDTKNRSNQENHSGEDSTPMHVKAKVDRGSIARKRTPIQTVRDPKGIFKLRYGAGICFFSVCFSSLDYDSDGDVSGDSLNDQKQINVTNDNGDNMTLVSALTTDYPDGYSYTELQEPKNGNKKSMIPKPLAKKPRKKVEVWKMQPISTKPYVPVPVTNA